MNPLPGWSGGGRPMRKTLLAAAAVGLTAAGCFAPFRWAEAPDAAPVEPAADHGDGALTRAAACLDRGEESAAVPHLREYVRANPSAHLTRAHLAELLYRHGEPAAARTEFEQFLAAAPPAGPAHAHRAHCHARLVSLAEDAGDAAAEHYHRGVGLLLLVEKWDADPARRDDVRAEQTCAQAAAALRAAGEDRPPDARVNLYLARAYARLGQSGPAETARRQARAGLPDPRLTAAERAELEAGDQLTRARQEAVGR